jgi:hypothetical protein
VVFCFIALILPVFAGTSGTPPRAFTINYARTSWGYKRGKIAEALEIKVGAFFNEEKPIDVNSNDKSIVEKLRLLDELEDIEKLDI